MYLRKVRINNIRSISEFEWKLPRGAEPGWHVVIGDNGAGKSTFLRSIALALVGPREAYALRQDWNEWLTRGKASGDVRVDLIYHRNADKFAGRGDIPDRGTLPAQVVFTRQQGDVELKKGLGNANRHVWSSKPGWFSASYGPFRRFAGGDRDSERIFYSNPKLASHLSVFGENVALSETISWLKELQYKKLEDKHSKEGKLLDSLTLFINQEGFLPHRARLQEVSSKGVEFVDGNGRQLPVEDLSDGYRSTLSMTFELIRQLSKSYSLSYIFNDDSTKIVTPGVVLIDEVDAHLHPSWQRQIGLWLRQHFPKMQFIVTTHSPLVCQAADVGSIWRLPKPGSDESSAMLKDEALERLLKGNVLDAYSTEMFGKNITRSEAAQKSLELLAELNVKETFGKLTDAEKRKQSQLRAALPTAANTLSRSK